MATTVDTTASATYALTYPYNNHKIDRCQNGVLWAVWWDTNPSTCLRLKYSTDNGATWNDPSTGGTPKTGGTSQVGFKLFIDLDDYAHLIYTGISGVIVYYKRGTPNAGRTDWTWSSEQTVDASANAYLPDIVAHREGTGWTAHAVYQKYDGVSAYQVYYRKISITSGHVITVDGSATQLSTSGATTGDIPPCIDFYHTGDAKTVVSSTPHLFVAWNVRNNGFFFRKASYSGGTWSWGTTRILDSTRHIVSTGDYWYCCFFDGTRVVIATWCSTISSGTLDLVFYERDLADTTTTTRVLAASMAAAQFLYKGGATFDSQGNVYIFGFNGDESSPNFDLVRRTWTRATTTLGDETVIDSAVPTDCNVALKRGYAQSRIEWLFISDTVYTVTYESLSVNTPPDTPTNLIVTSAETDTTPSFQCEVSDADFASSEQVKARFTIQTLGGSPVGTVDSSFVSSAGITWAEYTSGLSIGQYRVKAQAIDDDGATSAETSWVNFDVVTTVTQDIQYIWDVKEQTNKDLQIIYDTFYKDLAEKDLQLIWDVFGRIEKELELIYDVKVLIEKDVALAWDSRTPWVIIPEPSDTVWTPIVPPAFVGD